MNKYHFISAMLCIQSLFAAEESPIKKKDRTLALYQQSPAIQKPARPSCAFVFNFLHNVTAVAPCGPNAFLAGTDEGQVFLLEEKESEKSLQRVILKEPKPKTSCCNSNSVVAPIACLAALYQTYNVFAGCGDSIEKFDRLSATWKRIGTHKNLKALAVASDTRLVSIGRDRFGSLLKVWTSNKKLQWKVTKQTRLQELINKMTVLTDDKGLPTSHVIMKNSKGSESFEIDIDDFGFYRALLSGEATCLNFNGNIAVVSSKKKPTIEIAGQTKPLTLCSDDCHFNEELTFLSDGRLLTVDGHHNSQTQFRICDTILSKGLPANADDEKEVITDLTKNARVFDGMLPEFSVGTPGFPPHVVDC